MAADRGVPGREHRARSCGRRWSCTLMRRAGGGAVEMISPPRPRYGSIFGHAAAVAGLTLLAYLAAFELHRRLHFNPLANPVLIAVVLLVSTLYLTGTPYDDVILTAPSSCIFCSARRRWRWRCRSTGNCNVSRRWPLPVLAALVAGSLLTAALSASPDRGRVGREPPPTMRLLALNR